MRLAPIHNALHILNMPGANGAMLQQMWDMAERQVRHMARLLDDLLDVSHIRRGKIELRKETLDLTAVVNSSVEAVGPLFEQRQHELTVSPAASSLRVEGDATRLEQVLTPMPIYNEPLVPPRRLGYSKAIVSPTTPHPTRA